MSDRPHPQQAELGDQRDAGDEMPADEEKTLWVFQCYDEALGEDYTDTYVVRATKSAVEQLETDLRGRGHVTWYIRADVTVPDQIRAKHGW